MTMYQTVRVTAMVLLGAIGLASCTLAGASLGTYLFFNTAAPAVWCLAIGGAFMSALTLLLSALYTRVFLDYGYEEALFGRLYYKVSRWWFHKTRRFTNYLGAVTRNGAIRLGAYMTLAVAAFLFCFSLSSSL